MYPILSSMLMGLFQGAQARRRGRTSSVDATIRRVAAGVWAEVGAKHGLELTADPDLILRGAVRGVTCELALGGEGSSTYTLARATHERSLGGRLAVAPRTLGRALAARLTGARVQTGDSALDEDFIILSDPPGLADTLLDHEVRAALLAMRSRNPHIELHGGTITVELEGAEMVHENLHAIIDLLSRAPPEQPAAPYRT